MIFKMQDQLLCVEQPLYIFSGVPAALIGPVWYLYCVKKKEREREQEFKKKEHAVSASLLKKNNAVCFEFWLCAIGDIMSCITPAKSNLLQSISRSLFERGTWMWALRRHNIYSPPRRCWQGYFCLWNHQLHIFNLVREETPPHWLNPDRVSPWAPG